MANLTYTALTSLDGYIEDEDGGFDWAAPDPEVHAFVNGLERSVGAYFFGRRASGHPGRAKAARREAVWRRGRPLALHEAMSPGRAQVMSGSG